MEENKKSKLGLVILIGVLTTLVIGLSAFIIYDKVLTKDDNEQVETENKKDEVENKEEELEKEITKTSEKEKLEALITLFNKQSIFNWVGNNIGIYSNLSLSNSEKLQITFASLENKNKYTKVTIPQDKISVDHSTAIEELIALGGKQMTVSEVEDEYYALFNEKITSHENNISGCPGYFYDLNNSVYYRVEECGGSRGPESPISYINRYTYNGNEVYVYVNLGYVILDEESSVFKIYTDLEHKKLYKSEAKDNIDIDITDYNPNVINSSNYKDFSEYKYTFIKNDNGSYYFKSIEKIK